MTTTIIRLIELINADAGFETLLSEANELSHDDCLELLTALHSLNKVKLKKVISSQKKPAKKTPPPVKISLSRDEIIELFRNSSDEKILKAYKLPELKQMYHCVFNESGSKPRAPTTKGAITQAMRSLLYGIERARMFAD